MKQHIAEKQLNELSEKGQKRLKKWIAKAGYYAVWDSDMGKYGFIYGTLPLLSIGQMIEFLDEQCDREGSSGWIIKGRWGKSFRYTFSEDRHDDYLSGVDEKELCDALWQAVKEILEK